MEMEARMADQPPANRRALVRAGIVEDDVDCEGSRHGGVDLVQELAELARALSGKRLAEHRPVLRSTPRTRTWCRGADSDACGASGCPGSSGSRGAVRSSA